MSDLKPHPDKPGWYLLREVHYDHGHFRPPEEYWICVSPKLRLFDYPGGPARGQISQRDFDFYLNKSLAKQDDRLVDELHRVILRLFAGT